MDDTSTPRGLKIPWAKLAPRKFPLPKLNSRKRTLAAIGTVAGLVAATVAIGVSSAFAAPLFTDNFEDGNRDGWTTSGGTWAVATDGSRVLRQSGTSSDARARAGQTTWDNYTVTARVKATAFNGSNRFVAVLGRVQSNTSYYYVALRSNNTVELKKLVNGSSSTLASTSLTVSLNTWYTVSLQLSGSSLRSTVNGGAALTATDSQFARGQIGVATFNASANFDDVAVESGTTTPPTTTPPPTTTGPPTNPGTNVADGWASVNAWGQNGTTGGAGGSTVTVTNATQFLAEIANPNPRIILVSGMISLPGPMHDVTSNKTIVGVGANSGLTGGGLNIGLPIDNAITSPPANAVENIIIRNLNFRDWPDDAINVQMFSHHIWIDHNNWATGSDGGVDIKRGSSYVTVSWNHADGTDKNMLLGHDDNNAAQDVGRLKVTYHHNFFDNTNQRNPRVRFGDQVHVFNNFYLNTGDYGVASTMDAGVIVERNSFEGVDDPFHLGEASSGPGRLVARDNCFVNSGTGESGGSVSAVPYPYNAEPCANVKASVTAGAGTGRVGVPGGPTNPPPTTPPPTTPPPTTPPPTTPPPPPPGGIIGWATQSGGTTGGAGGSTVTVSSFADFRTQAQAAGARTILVNGMLSGSGVVEITANKTIRGVGANSGISGTTLNIEDMSPANVIIQNMNIRGVRGTDAIQIENASHIWIDHNTMSSTIESDPDVYDGMIDITHAGDYITISWNIVRDHWKNSLVGHSDGNESEDTGHLRITYHHNWFDRTFERSPRVRFGETVHVFNNYYSNINNNTESYAIASTMDAGVLVEGNVFENVQQACWSASGYADSDPGRLVARNNSLTNSGPCEVNGSVAALPYGYTAENVNSVKSSVTAGAGAGRI
jgi:pectate lyase